MSSPMTLHWSPRSPYVRKVMIAAHEMGLTDRIQTVRTTVGGTIPHLELMRINPLGKIPTLELEDGTVIYDSPVIIEYLDTLHTGAKLYPSAERQSEPHKALWRAKLRASADALEHEAEALGRGQFTVGHLAIGVALAY